MEWLQLAGPGLGFLGVIAGGWLAKRKPKVEANSVVIADATSFGQSMYEKLNEALRRIDALEDKDLQRDELARQHIRWDWKLMRQLHEQGIEVSDPPPLFVYDNLTKGS